MRPSGSKRSARRFWIVALLAALIPLRAWALGAMAPTDSPAAATPPCHQLDGEPLAASTCAVCGLCHLPAAPVAPTAIAATAVPESPVASAVHDTGRRQAERLDRPPFIRPM